MRDFSAVALSEFPEFIQSDSQLSQDFIEERRTDLASRAVALDIHYLSCVRGQRKAFFAVLFHNHAKDIAQFCQRCFSRIHQRVTTRDRRNLSDPRTVLLSVKNSLVIF